MAEIDINTLCAEILDGWDFRRRGADALGAYHRQLLDLMCDELAVEWQDDTKKLRDI